MLKFPTCCKVPLGSNLSLIAQVGTVKKLPELWALGASQSELKTLLEFLVNSYERHLYWWFKLACPKRMTYRF